MNLSDIPARVLNSRFVDKIVEQGMVKEASDSVSGFTRDILRENGIARQIIPPITITEDDLDRDIDTDKPKIIVDKEVGAKASYVSFRGLPDSRYFTGPRYPIYFAKIQTEKYQKNIFELKTYDIDIRKVLSDNAVLEMQSEEDGKFFTRAATIVTTSATTALQDLSFPTGLTKENVLESFTALPTLRKPFGVAVLNAATAIRLLKFQANDIGNAAATEQYYKGLTTGTLWGRKILVTIKNDLIPDNVMWMFSTPEFLGKFFIMQDATTFIKHEADFIEWYTYEALGMGFGTEDAIVRADFNNPAIY
jgi:hypothetical protein